MPINFPDFPSDGDTFVFGGSTFVWNGFKWDSLTYPVSGGPTGPVGPVGPTGPDGTVARVFVDDVAPSSDVVAGDLWWNSVDASLYVFYDDGSSSQWVVSSLGAAGPNLVSSDTVTGFSGFLRGDGSRVFSSDFVLVSEVEGFDSVGVGSSIVPSSDLAFDLGASDARWRDLYLSGSSIFLGDAVLSSSDGGLSVSSSGGASVAFLTASDAVDFADAVHTHLSSDVTNFVEATQGVVTKAYVDGLGVNAATLNGTDVSAFATAAQGSLADTAVQPGESLTVPDGGTIGSVSASDAITVDGNGIVGINNNSIINNQDLPLQLSAGDTNERYFSVNKGNDYGALFGYANNDSSFGNSVIIRAVQSSEPIKFLTNNTQEQARFTGDGYFRMASGTSGIQFNGDTAAGNALDDYEEGTFTPTLLNGGTLTITSAAYTKIGRMVLFSLYIQNIAPTNNSSQFRIGGLPFTPNNTSYSSVTIGYVGDANMDDWVALTSVNNAHIYFHVASGNGSARTNAQYISAASGSLDRLILSGFYFTN